MEKLEYGHCDVPGWGESGDLTANQNGYSATILNGQVAWRDNEKCDESMNI